MEHDMSLMDTLKAKAAAAQGQDGKPVTIAEIAAETQKGTVVSGMAGSNAFNVVAQITSPAEEHLSNEVDTELAKDCVAVYKDLKPLKRIFNARGLPLAAVGGFFYVKDEAYVEFLEDAVTRGFAEKV
jgi:hypothetical protein